MMPTIEEQCERMIAQMQLAAIEIESLRKELAELRRDKERLDFLRKSKGAVFFENILGLWRFRTNPELKTIACITYDGFTPESAIDSAMAKEAGK